MHLRGPFLQCHQPQHRRACSAHQPLPPSPWLGKRYHADCSRQPGTVTSLAARYNPPSDPGVPVCHFDVQSQPGPFVPALRSARAQRQPAPTPQPTTYHQQPTYHCRSCGSLIPPYLTTSDHCSPWSSTACISSIATVSFTSAAISPI